jgi:3-(3-hydroxy-phenyl)propionate hydroxylase
METSSREREFVPYPFEYRRHAPPPVDAPAEAATHPVAIVGGGIAGLTLALELAVQGLRSVVIEADETVCVGSRAICFSRRSLEIFERIGVLEPILAKGLAWTGGRSFYRDTEVLRFSMPHDRLQKLPPMINLQQYHVEEALVRALERHPGLAELRWQSRVTGLTEHADHVALRVQQPGRAYALRAGWVVACDGGRSSVREALGLRLQGTAYEGRYVVADIALRCDLPTERLAWFDPPSNPGSTILMHRQPDDIWRIDYQLRDDEDGEAAVRPEQVLPRVDAHLRMIGLGADWSPIWITLYKANALTLERYRHGRCLFAGDAAHLVPIFGVRGANSTIDDADNLAWKLALVARGRAPPDLLDSYSSERVDAARENLAYGQKSTQFMAPPDFACRMLREAVLGLAVTTPQLRPLINPRQSSPIRYAASPLNATSAQGSPAGDGFAAGPAAGSVLPTAPVGWVADGGGDQPGHFTDFLVAGHFSVIHFAAEGPFPVAVLTATEALRREHGLAIDLVGVRPQAGKTGVGHRAVDATGELAALYGVAWPFRHSGAAGSTGATAAGAPAEPQAALYAVRPDGHVLGRWRLDAEAAASHVAAALTRAIAACLAVPAQPEERESDDDRR